MLAAVVLESISLFVLLLVYSIAHYYMYVYVYVQVKKLSNYILFADINNKRTTQRNIRKKVNFFCTKILNTIKKIEITKNITYVFTNLHNSKKKTSAVKDRSLQCHRLKC